MSNDNKFKKSSDPTTWLLQGLELHAEKQVETFTKVMMRCGGNIPSVLAADLRASQELLNGSTTLDEVHHDAEELIHVEALAVKRLSSFISSPREVARALGHIKDGKPNFRRWYIVGDRRVIYCTKHCNKGHPLTRGYNYAYQDDDGIWSRTNALCEKCIRELGDRKQSGRLAAMLGMKRSYESNDQVNSKPEPVATKAKDPEWMTVQLETGGHASSDTAEKLADREVLPTVVHKSKRPDGTPDLMSYTVNQLRDMCAEKGIVPIPRLKMQLVAALQ
jgi:hypothetical protein